MQPPKEALSASQADGAACEAGAVCPENCSLHGAARGKSFIHLAVTWLS